jgi:hypothetical protein
MEMWKRDWPCVRSIQPSRANYKLLATTYEAVVSIGLYGEPAQKASLLWCMKNNPAGYPQQGYVSDTQPVLHAWTRDGAVLFEVMDYPDNYSQLDHDVVIHMHKNTVTSYCAGAELGRNTALEQMCKSCVLIAPVDLRNSHTRVSL